MSTITAPHAFVVMVLGYWGRGTTLKEAALACQASGATLFMKAVVYLIVGDDAPTVSGMGDLVYNQGAFKVYIGKWLPIRLLCALTEEGT